MAAAITRIFWLHFYRVGESGDASSIFIYSLWSVCAVHSVSEQYRMCSKCNVRLAQCRQNIHTTLNQVTTVKLEGQIVLHESQWDFSLSMHDGEVPSMVGSSP